MNRSYVTINNMENSNIPQELEEWLVDRIRHAPGSVTVADLAHIIGNLLARVRLFYTRDEVMDILLGIMLNVERSFNEGDTFLDPDTREPAQYYTPEQQKQLGIQGAKVEIPDTIPAEWK